MELVSCLEHLAEEHREQAVMESTADFFPGRPMVQDEQPALLAAQSLQQALM